MLNHEGHTAKLLKSRSSLIELVIVAILLALAINLIAGSALSLLGAEKIKYALYTGLSIVTLTLIYFAYRILRGRTAISALKGAFVIDSESGHFVEIPLYEYSSDVKMYLQSAFAENAALEKAWKEHPISEALQFDSESRTTRQKETKGIKLLQEASEYFLLDQFSLHLSSYFEEHELDEARLTKLSREDIPSILLSNRFLELFSKPMEDREAFVNDVQQSSRGDVVASWSKGGMFSRFELILPKKSIVTRNRDGCIKIETPRLVLEFKCMVSPFNADLPRGVERYVLGETEPMQFSVHEAEIWLTARFKFGALLLPSGWEYYRWFDSFSSSIREKFSIDDFFERRGWHLAETMLYMIRPNNKKADKPPHDQII